MHCLRVVNFLNDHVVSKGKDWRRTRLFCMQQSCVICPKIRSNFVPIYNKEFILIGINGAPINEVFGESFKQVEAACRGFHLSSLKLLVLMESLKPFEAVCIHGITQTV